MKNTIEKIMKGEDLDEIINYVKKQLFINGPTSTTVLEMLVYLKIFQSDLFENHENDILEFMGVFYKKNEPHSLKGQVFSIYESYILEKFGQHYTPVQAKIVDSINTNKYYSFSAPTSTGKSFVFRNIIEKSEDDIVIVVPSRALINEYYDRVSNLVDLKHVNVLTFVDKINTKHAAKSVFILTPERAKELFKFKNEFKIELFLFDEAQLSNEESTRGLFFDSIVRRIQKGFPDSKVVFAHPFVKNPEAQFIKNGFTHEKVEAYQYKQQNVGQIFYTNEKESFYHFGVDKSIMGSKKVMSSYDPISKTIKSGGSILVYTTKSSIYDKKVFAKFSRYISLCPTIIEDEALVYIDELKNYIGVKDTLKSHLIELLYKGIVIHHGSLPLKARLILEHFTQKGFCRICFATSTLEQGINMPFDIVYLNTFQASKPLSLKNLIGRAGRSSLENKFDYGIVIMNQSNMSKFRDIMNNDEVLNETSLLDVEDNEKNDDYKEFKEAINNNDFSDEFNLTNSMVERLSSAKVDLIVNDLLNHIFEKDQFITLKAINRDTDYKLKVYGLFENLYMFYLNGRLLSDGEKSVFNTAIKIMFWKIHCKTFKDICWYRYAYASRISERTELKRLYDDEIKSDKKSKIKREASNMYAKFISGYAELPNKELRNYSMFGNKEVKANEVDYDRIVFDTYDYLDKLLGFRLSDIFYAIFFQYYEKKNDQRALRLSNFIKYGTDDATEIWLLRYGFDFEDIEWIKNYVVHINEEEIVFNKNIHDLAQEKIDIISKFVVE